MREVDALGLKCPLPVLKAQKLLAQMPPGARLRISADDPMAAIDLPHFCTQAGHRILALEADPPAWIIERGPAQPD